jgi:hypothetical protein
MGVTAPVRYAQGMLGYILVIGLGLVLLAVFAATLGPLRAGLDHGAKETREQPLQANQPAADEPTPDLSVTATHSEIAAARRHTPPA